MWEEQIVLHDVADAPPFEVGRLYRRRCRRRQKPFRAMRPGIGDAPTPAMQASVMLFAGAGRAETAPSTPGGTSSAKSRSKEGRRLYSLNRKHQQSQRRFFTLRPVHPPQIASRPGRRRASHSAAAYRRDRRAHRQPASGCESATCLRR
jgi:hypothetical protein